MRKKLVKGVEFGKCRFKRLILRLFELKVNALPPIEMAAW